MDQNIPCQFFSFENTNLAVRYRKGSCSPGLVWLHGYQSDMLSSKAMMIDMLAQKNNLSCLRFDYSGHGESEGDFFQGTISRWVEESLAVIEAYCEGPQILIGNSMGGWIALKLATTLAKKSKMLAGMILVAPAPDFTRTVVDPLLGPLEWEVLEEKGYIGVPAIGAIGSVKPRPVSKVFIQDGRNNYVMKGCIDVGCPVHILHGMEDEQIPYKHTLSLLDHLPLHDVTLTLIRDADHSLSRPQDLVCLEAALKSLIDQINVE
ncbi:alpha/beta hydrolase [Bartonella sp. CB175]|uniref:alpha/beta hydrolase n=1 Tax=Bartonella sp. CB175 TaxID=3112256 RepID=UPI00300E5F8E